MNSSKTMNIHFSRYRTPLPEHPDISLDGIVIENVVMLKLFGVFFDRKVTFSSHIATTARIAPQKIGILRKSWHPYREDKKCFYAFILTFLEYCSVVWRSATFTYLQQIQRVFNSGKFRTPIGISLDHRRDVATACLFFIRSCRKQDTHCTPGCIQ